MEIRDAKQSPYRRFFTQNITVEELVLQAKQRENVVISENTEKCFVCNKPIFGGNTDQE